ncbi:MAG: protein translocase subunit SecF [Proteobacteria bacterium]|jgi:preprotein translocase subunit SecF|nr:protein translocase subunit SecF [Candidatus Fonsibacter sp. PEL5]NKA16330.1 protein translocase subunit SecF [Candidatus Fonsibacter sp. PEL55]
MTNFNFLKYKNFFLFFSTFLVLASIILVFTKGLDFGVDFKGGTTIEIRLEKKIEIEKIRNSLSKFKINNYSVKEFGTVNDFLISTDNSVSPNDIKNFIEKDLKEKIIIRKVETVGPKVGSELIKSAIYSVLLCFVAMFLYLWFRFEWQFSFGGIVALFHDTIITVGVFSLLGLQFDLTIVAALLTIIGYSINDTVIIYDRIRENLKKDSSSELSILVNESLNNTLSRTLKTSGTTLLSIIAVLIFGGEVLRGFAFAITFGIIIGTYSSIYIASPIVMFFKVKRDWSVKIDNTP